MSARPIKVAFAGTFAATLEEPVRARLTVPSEVVVADEPGIVATLADIASRGLLGARELSLMKPTAFLVNVARAEVVDEAALYRTLADRRIAGAALDVWYRYPRTSDATAPSHHPFHELPNVLMTPHVSGWTEGMLAARADVIAGNLARVARGEPPVNLIPTR